jgi:uncharacterized protein (DUF2132 family)
MQAPYLPLFDESFEFDEAARSRIGLTTALLFVKRQQWMHRRVELVTFEDQDVIRRSSSVDFTLPSWTAERLGVDPLEPSKIVVPITLFRKRTLAHFSLSDEANNAIPLLSGKQVSPLAAMALIATGELALGHEVPKDIVTDIEALTSDRRIDEDNERRLLPSDSFNQLFSVGGSDSDARVDLKANKFFRPMAEAFDDNYIAAVLLTIAGGDRRIIHFAYDEEIGERDGLRERLQTTRDMFFGRISRRVLVQASSASDVASFHIEAEAPEGLRISSRVRFTPKELAQDEEAADKTENSSWWNKLWQKDEPKIDSTSPTKPFERAGSYRRAHIHCNDVPPNAEMTVVLRLGPRSSTIVRGAALTAGLTLLAVLYARLRLPEIVKKETGGPAAVLLVIPTLLSVWVARSEEHPATTHLLWPLRIVATSPAVFGFAAAGVLVTGGDTAWSKGILDVAVGLLTIATLTLSATWIGAIRRHGRPTALPTGDARVPSEPSGSLDQSSEASVAS